MTRTKVIIAGGIGLFANLLTTSGCVLIHYFWLPALLPQPLIAWVMFLFFGAIALFEIPIMIYGLRKVAGGSTSSAINAALFGSGGFVFFAAVYALPNLLLSDIRQLWMGLVIAGISFLRFGAAIIFLPTSNSSENIKP